MFIVIYDPYGVLVDAVCVSSYNETMEEAVESMQHLFELDCISEKCDEDDRNKYIDWSGDTYMFTPRGYEDAMYKVIEI